MIDQQQRMKRKLELEEGDEDEDLDLDLLLLVSSSSVVRSRSNAMMKNRKQHTTTIITSSSHLNNNNNRMIQLFVKTFSSSSNYQNNNNNNHSTLVLFGKPDDTIKSIHVKIEAATGIPVSFQRLIYAGKQLHSHHTLIQSNITNDSSLHLVARMQSTPHPRASRLVNDLLSFVYRLRNHHHHVDDDDDDDHLINSIHSKLKEFSETTFPPDNQQIISAKHLYHASVYLNIFLSYCAPEALVMLYMSPPHKQSALNSLQFFITSVPKPFYPIFTPLLLHFSKLLISSVAHDDPFYIFCRNRLGSMLTSVTISSSSSSNNDDEQVVISAHDLLPFVYQLATHLSQSLHLSTDSSVNFDCDVIDFTNFVRPIKKSILHQVPVQTPIHSLPMHYYYYSNNPNPHPCHIRDFLYTIFLVLSSKMKACLNKVEEHIKVGKHQVDMNGWDHYLSVLTQVYHIAKLYQGAEEIFMTDMRLNKVSLCHLILRYAKRGEDYNWILHHKDLTDFHSRRHLVMLLLPELKNDDYENIHEMLIDRSQLLAESFNYILLAKTEALRSGLFMEFKNEEATGPGVLREWFFLVCQSIFNPHNALFVPCPNDRRRFFPNPASKVDPMHLDYYKFAGRVIALALMHKMQVGIVFDRTFFLQLAGVDISLDDVKDADPYLYSSSKQILDMDPCAVDEDALGLTFVWEVEELGSMKVLELLPNGKHIPVNSRNRKEYVHLLIRHRFVTSITQQVTQFAQGFTDIVTKDEIRKLFFKSLELRDLDGMLYGSESDISVDDWKAHTEYKGYKVTDSQIYWFWKIVGEMTAEQRKVLLFFWTSVKYLPVEGFGGLASKLYICRSIETVNRLPSSHTCFYQICFPAYPSMAVMQLRLNTITQEHVGCSFGTW